MPAKITLNTTDRANGLISVTDVIKMRHDYSHKLILANTDPTRNPVHKHFYFNISESQINLILEQRLNPNAPNSKRGTFIQVHLVLNLPDQINCDNTESIGDYISIIVSGIDEDNLPMLNVNDEVLVEGFKDYRRGFNDVCCVVGDPPKPGGSA